MSSANKHNEEEDDGDIGDQVSSIVDLHLPTLSQINLPELNSSAPESDIDESTVGLSFRRALGEVSPPFHDLPNDLASFTQEINREYQTDMDVNFETCKRFRGSSDENLFDEPLSKECRHLEDIDINSTFGTYAGFRDPDFFESCSSAIPFSPLTHTPNPPIVNNNLLNTPDSPIIPPT